MYLNRYSHSAVTTGPKNQTRRRAHSKKYQVNATAYRPSLSSREQTDDGAPTPYFQISAEVETPAQDSRHGLLSKWLKILIIVVPILWGYEQYLEQNFRARIDQAEQDLRAATEQLGAESPGVRATGVRTIYDLAFKELPVDPDSNWYAPPVNLTKWVIGRRERRLLDRARNLFREFASTPRTAVEDTKNPVSTAILKTGIEWISKENAVFGKSKQDPSLWFFYRAKLSKAYAPGSNLEGIQFYDVDISHAVMNSSNLTDAYLEGANLEGTSLESCQLINANLRKANLKGAKLNFALLNTAKLAKADLTGADLTLARLNRADLQNTILNKALLRTTDLQEAILKGADLRNTNFSQANIRGTDFTGADLRGADLRFVTGITEVKSWLGAKISGAQFPPGFTPQTKEPRT